MDPQWVNVDFDGHRYECKNKKTGDMLKKKM